jgi:hypothetical protein
MLIIKESIKSLVLGNNGLMTHCFILKTTGIAETRDFFNALFEVSVAAKR